MQAFETGPNSPLISFEYIYIVFIVATSVHLPSDLLARIDQRAGELGVSRNRYIVRALESAVEGETAWSQSFLEMMDEAARDTENHEAVDEMMRTISSRRTSKRPPKL